MNIWRIATIWLGIGIVFTGLEVFANYIDWYEHIVSKDKDPDITAYVICMALAMFACILSWPGTIPAIPSYAEWIFGKIREKLRKK